MRDLKNVWYVIKGNKKCILPLFLDSLKETKVVDNIQLLFKK